MNSVLSPLCSEFESTEQEASYKQWLRAKVAASLAESDELIAHDEVISEVEVLIQQAEKMQKRAARCFPFCGGAQHATIWCTLCATSLKTIRKLRAVSKTLLKAVFCLLRNTHIYIALVIAYLGLGKSSPIPITLCFTA